MNKPYHSLLSRQLRRQGIKLESVSPEMLKLFDAINETYRQSDVDREMIERSLQLSSEELFTQNQEMRRTLEMFPEILNKTGSITAKQNFRELLINHVAEIERSRNQIIQQSEMLQSQALELASARDSALEHSRAKSEFLANMSHEIRTPMNGILGMLQIIQSTKLEKDQSEYVTIAERATFSLLSLLNDILDFSKIEAGRLDIEKVEFNLREMIKVAVLTLALQAEEKGLELFAWIDPRVPETLKGDSHRLRQVVVNLLGNALKFTESGFVLLKIDLVVENTIGSSTLIIQVQDTGTGIADDQHQKVFYAFQQADGSTSRRFGGTGLGLTISQQLVKMMGGEIRLKSTLGVGSTFYFELKHSGFDAQVAKTDTRLWDYHEAPGRIVLVSSSALLPDFLRNYFSYFGDFEFECCEFESAGNLLSTLDANRDFIIFDVVARTAKPDNNVDTNQVHILKEYAARGFRLLCLQPLYGQHIERSAFERCPPVILNSPFLDTELTKAIQQVYRQAETASIQATDSARSLPASQGLRVVVVDDIAINRLVAVKLLELQGHQAEALSSGEELLNRLGAHDDRKNSVCDCDIIFLDIQMPGLDGVETAKKIRAAGISHQNLAHLKVVPIVALTAHALTGDRERFIQAGMDEYLSKPLVAESLQKIITRIFPERMQHVEHKSDTLPTLESTLPSTSAAQTELKDFDFGMLLERFQGNRQFVFEIFEIFKEEEPQLSLSLASAIASGDRAAVKKAAHALKGSLINVASNFALEQTSAVEILAETGNDEQINVRYTLLQSAIEALRTRIDEALEKRDQNTNTR